MAKSLGTLLLNLRVNSDHFSRGVKDATTQSNKLSKAFRGVAVAAGALLSVAAVKGFTSMLKTELELIDKTTKLAKRLDISTEAVIGFRHAAERSGLSVQEFDTGLERLAKNIGDINLKSGEARHALDKLGLSAEKMAGQTLEQNVYDIAGAFENLSDSTEKMAVATSLFGRSGTGFINFLDNGKEGIRTLSEMAEKLGITYDTMSGEDAEAAIDALTDMEKAFGGLKTQLALEFADDFENFAKRVTDFVTSEDANKLKEDLAVMAEGFGSLSIQIAKTGSNAVTAAKEMKTLIDLVAEYAETRERNQKLQDEIDSRINERLRGSAEDQIQRANQQAYLESVVRDALIGMGRYGEGQQTDTKEMVDEQRKTRRTLEDIHKDMMEIQ